MVYSVASGGAEFIQCKAEDTRCMQGQTGTWPLLLTWVLDSLSSQKPLPVTQYEVAPELPLVSPEAAVTCAQT